MAYKTYEQWGRSGQSLDKYLQVGDIVDQEMVNYFINCVLPSMFTDDLIQLGEPYDHINGKPVFPTLKKTLEGWMYMGNCYKGEYNNITR